MADDLIERLEELIIADAFEAGHITSSMLAERLIKERAEAAARITALEAEVERLTRERDIAIGERVARSKTMAKLRDKLSAIRLDDEIDRVYFRSTNDADDFRDLVQEIEEWKWHDIMRESQQSDPFEASRKAHERADRAEAALASKDAEIERKNAALNSIVKGEMAVWDDDLQTEVDFWMSTDDMQAIAVAALQEGE